MGLSSEEREKQSLRVKSLRRKCKITQEEAARLLGITKNTWVRWESGRFRKDRLKLELLPYLARGKGPQPCSEYSRKNFNIDRMAEHIQTCRRCWLAANYLSMVRKNPPQ